MVGRINGTYGLARGVAAMLTHHRHEAGVEVGASVFPALVVSFDTDPRHFATGQNFSSLPIRTNRRNIVLCVARTHARGASSAAREIDGHRPAPLGHAAPVI